jgi:hypothetical protein
MWRIGLSGTAGQQIWLVALGFLVALLLVLAVGAEAMTLG